MCVCRRALVYPIKFLSLHVKVFWENVNYVFNKGQWLNHPLLPQHHLPWHARTHTQARTYLNSRMKEAEFECILTRLRPRCLNKPGLAWPWRPHSDRPEHTRWLAEEIEPVNSKKVAHLSPHTVTAWPNVGHTCWACTDKACPCTHTFTEWSSVSNFKGTIWPCG